MRGRLRENKYFRWGITAFVVIVVALICNQIMNKWDNVSAFGSVVLVAMRPVIMGLIIAYVLNPLLKIYEKYVFEKLFSKIIKRNDALKRKFVRGLGIFATMITALAIVAGLILLIIPELYVNINRLVTSLPGYVENAINYVTELSKEYPDMATPVVEYLSEVGQGLLVWARERLLPNANLFVTNLYKSIYGTLRAVLDVIIGMIVAVYVLGAKETYAAGARKFAYALFKENTAKIAIKLCKYTDYQFGGFLVGKIVDSAIIGVLSFVVFTVFNIPYTLLVSVVVGVTNVIPFFGPFLGAIPSAILILLVDPVKALIFSVLILAIQQLDGNIIGPKILGNKTGLDSFAVIFSILIFGGLFGVVGMIVGVPVFATVFGIVTEVANKSLEKKCLPTDIQCYKDGKEVISVNKKTETEE